MATYDALYCRADGTPPPYIAVVQDHFGTAHAFGKGGTLEKVAQRTGTYPEHLTVRARTTSNAWNGYADTGAGPAPGGRGADKRVLYRHEKGARP